MVLCCGSEAVASCVMSVGFVKGNNNLSYCLKTLMSGINNRVLCGRFMYLWKRIEKIRIKVYLVMGCFGYL